MKISELFETKEPDEGWYVVTQRGSQILEGPFKTKAEAIKSGVSAGEEPAYGYPGAEGRLKHKKLDEAYAAPVKNPKLGYRPDSKIPVGGSKEWLKAFGATPQHVEQALRHLRQSGLIQKLQKLGLFDESSDRHNKNGSIMFTGTMGYPVGAPGSTPRTRRIKFTVQPNGKIDETAPNDFHRAPLRTGKPHIVPGDPVGSIVKTMTNSMTKLVDTMERRRESEKKLFAKHAKGQAK